MKFQYPVVGYVDRQCRGAQGETIWTEESHPLCDLVGEEVEIESCDQIFQGLKYLEHMIIANIC